MKHKILVSGATGFVASHLIKRLLQEKYQVGILFRKNSDRRRLKKEWQQLIKFEADLLEENKVKLILKKFRPQIIFHLASKIVFDQNDLADKNLIKNNFLGTVNLIDACNQINYKCFINSGSSSEYGLENNPMKESDFCKPIDSYGFSKLTATLYAIFIAKTKNKPIINIRLFSPFGPFDQPQKLIPYVIFQALKNRDLYLASPDSARDFIYIKDVVDLYFRAIDKAEKFKGEIFNLGRGEQESVRWIVAKILNLTNSKSKVFWNKNKKKPWDTKNWQADMGKTRKFFVWRPRYSTEAGLKENITWCKKNLDYYQDYYEKNYQRNH